MQLDLSRQEVEEILLAYAEKIMPGKFNNVNIKNYVYDLVVTLAYVEPEKPKGERIE